MYVLCDSQTRTEQGPPPLGANHLHSPYQQPLLLFLGHDGGSLGLLLPLLLVRRGCLGPGPLLLPPVQAPCSPRRRHPPPPPSPHSRHVWPTRRWAAVAPSSSLRRALSDPSHSAFGHQPALSPCFELISVENWNPRVSAWRNRSKPGPSWWRPRVLGLANLHPEQQQRPPPSPKRPQNSDERALRHHCLLCLVVPSKTHALTLNPHQPHPHTHAPSTGTAAVHPSSHGRPRPVHHHTPSAAPAPDAAAAAGAARLAWALCGGKPVARGPVGQEADG